jgi:hypothetical protein
MCVERKEGTVAYRGAVVSCRGESSGCTCRHGVEQDTLHFRTVDSREVREHVIEGEGVGVHAELEPDKGKSERKRGMGKKVGGRGNRLLGVIFQKQSLRGKTLKNAAKRKLRISGERVRCFKTKSAPP